jgi:hypothetical protein
MVIARDARKRGATKTRTPGVSSGSMTRPYATGAALWWTFGRMEMKRESEADI